MPATPQASCSFLFDLLHLDGEDLAARPLIAERGDAAGADAA
jgi:ATP-dependent DNA ligase